MGGKAFDRALRDHLRRQLEMTERGEAFDIAVLYQALIQLDARIQAEPIDAYSRHMAQLRKLPAYIPTETEMQRLKVVEKLCSRLEREPGFEVPGEVIVDELDSEERGVLIEALRRRVEMLRRGRGFPEEVLETIKGDVYSVTRAEYLAAEEDVLRRLEAIQGDGAKAGDAPPGRRFPGGFIGFCCGKIEAMPPEERERFLSVNSGDSSFYDVPKQWNDEWEQAGNKAYKEPGQGVSKAKAVYQRAE